MHTDKLITSAGTADENSTKDDGLHVSPRLHKTKCYMPFIELRTFFKMWITYLLNLVL